MGTWRSEEDEAPGAGGPDVGDLSRRRPQGWYGRPWVSGCFYGQMDRHCVVCAETSWWEIVRDGDGKVWGMVLMSLC